MKIDPYKIELLMPKYLISFVISVFFVSFILIKPANVFAMTGQASVSPNDFEGTDTERISQAIQKAKNTSNLVRIPRVNANGTNIWMIDSAILLPSNLTLVLDNCTLQLSDSSRDNMFRSDNVGLGITDPEWNENINKALDSLALSKEEYEEMIRSWEYKLESIDFLGEEDTQNEK